MPSEKKVDIIMSEIIKADIVSQGHYDVLNWYVAGSSSVKNLERIKKVEIWLKSSFDLGAFKLSLQEYVVFKNFCKLSLLDSVEATLVSDCSLRLLVRVR